MTKIIRTALLAVALGFSISVLAQDAVNVNQASVESLASLPGIGEVKAQAIVDERETHGAFESLEDLTRVSGIGPKTVDNLGDDATL
ncbi:ComEA family DNA-binding protein [Salinicola aestuarinus]|uniref:ComEA family DNA-binding protein n=1 Tax=Salinicola aestuarinus TaxID=1949082 RepID=UPI000DA1A185|nr:ComEA family DNA-binding protein [Salinicola aestuarinus]